MKISLRPLFTALAIAFGLIVLLGYFFDFAGLRMLRQVFLQWAAILTAVAMLIGVFNLAAVHWRKVITEQKGGLHSAVLLIALLLTVIVILLFGGPTAPAAQWIFSYVLLPIESSLAAILAVILAYACARLLGRRFDLFSLVFMVTALLSLIGMASIPGLDFPLLNDLRAMITQVLAVGGARGVLLGVALGTVATGLRILMGADRPYGGS